MDQKQHHFCFKIMIIEDSGWNKEKRIDKKCERGYNGGVTCESVGMVDKHV